MLALVMAPLWGFPDYFGRGVHRTLTKRCFALKNHAVACGDGLP